MKDSRQFLQLVDDPVARTLGMLKSMPLERVVACLELVAATGNRLGLLSSQDKARIAELLAQVPVANLEKAA
jgi:hypothetical protein